MGVALLTMDPFTRWFLLRRLIRDESPKPHVNRQVSDNWNFCLGSFMRFSPPTTACQRFLSFTFSFEAGSSVENMDKNIGNPPRELKIYHHWKKEKHLQKYLLEGICSFLGDTFSYLPTLLDTLDELFCSELRWQDCELSCHFFSGFFLQNWRPFATSFLWHPSGFVSSDRWEESGTDVQCITSPEGRTATSAGVGGSEGPGWDIFVKS